MGSFARSSIRSAPPFVVVTVLLGLLSAVPVVSQVASPAAGTPAPAPAPRVSPSQGTIPVVRERRYSMSVKIRPLLFWVGKANVGGARARWRQGPDGARGYDLLIGADPARAPRDINRWGFILEEMHGDRATIVGVSRRGEDGSFDGGTVGVANEGANGYFFKMIAGRSDARESVATVTMTRVGKDYSYRELDTLFDAFARFPGTPKVKRVGIPPGGRHGFLLALADLIHETTESVRQNPKGAGRKAYPYVYYGYQYDLTRTGVDIQRNAVYGGRAYDRLVKVDVDLTERGDTWKETFSVVCGIDGPLAEVPVFAAYQPRWWLKAELTLDDRETF